MPTSHVDLYWLPLGAGGHFVRTNGRVYEALAARLQHRERSDLYHSALEVQLDGDRYVIEQAPAWNLNDPDRGVVCQGAVGAPWLGRFKLFRYEVRRWRDGVIPDRDEAVDSPRRLSADADRARQVLDLVPSFPTATWGRDEQRTGEMWNSNSLIAWLLARSGHDTSAISPPARGRAPGWAAGLSVAARAAGVAGSLNHLRLSVRDPAASERFYDPLLSLLGYVQIPRDDGGRAWERRDLTAGAQWLIFTPVAAEHRDAAAHDLTAPGFHHLALNAVDRAQVDRAHEVLVSARRGDPRPARGVRLRPRVLRGLRSRSRRLQDRGRPHPLTYQSATRRPLSVKANEHKDSP